MIAQKLPGPAHHRRGHLDRGAAAVEMALVLPVLLLFLMGIIDFGRVFNAQIQLSQAAREGARVAALGFSEPDVIARTTAALNNPGFQGSAASIVVRVVNSSGAVVADHTGNVCIDTDPVDVANNFGQVTVSIPYNKILFGPASLSQKAVMKCSG